MAVIIETATKKDDVVPLTDGAACDGFVAGDAQVGVAATQLSPKFFNGVTGEINNVILGIHGPVAALDTDDYSQMMTAIGGRLLQNYPKSALVTPWLFDWRSQHHSEAAAAEWMERRRSDRRVNAPDNALYNLCPFTPPDLAQSVVEYTVVMVGTNDLTTRCNVVIKASVRRNGGTVTVQSQATAFDDSPDGTVTVEVIGTAVVCRVDVPVVGENVNIFVTGTITNVTQNV